MSPSLSRNAIINELLNQPRLGRRNVLSTSKYIAICNSLPTTTNSSTSLHQTYQYSWTLWLKTTVLQNIALGIVSKYSRLSDGPKYNPGTVIFMVELLKFILCSLVVYKAKEWKINASIACLRYEVFGDHEGLKKMIFLAFLYAMQNTAALFAYDYVDVATYQIVYQLKIITTALFMIVLLQRRFSIVQWIAMVSLMVGVTICSNSRFHATEDVKKISETDTTSQVSRQFIGTCIVIGLAVNSGLAAAYFERVLKAHKPKMVLNGTQLSEAMDPLWVRNLQLSAVSVVVCVVGLLRQSSTILQDGFFYGFHPMVYAVIFLQAVGGLTVAAVVRYSDNIVKNFGTSFSLVFSCIISNYMFDQEATWSFYIGVFLVVGSVLVYGDKRFAVQQAAPLERKETGVSGKDGDHQIDVSMQEVQLPKRKVSGKSTVRTAAAAFSVVLSFAK